MCAIPLSNSSNPANAGERATDSRRRKSRAVLTYPGANLTYSQAMKSAQGAKLGTTTRITENDTRNPRIPERQFLAEFCNAPSMVLMSEVNLLRMRPTGVVSKNRSGARVILRINEMNREREACRLA